MKLLGFDTETTGLDPEKDEVTEIGAVLFDTDSHQPVRITGYLVKVSKPVSKEITALTGITSEMLDLYGIASKPALESVLRQMKSADFMCAHNAPFDKGFLQAWCKREGVEMPEIPWIDTKCDLVEAAYLLGKSASLKYLAADHGFVYPAHRAVNDVLAMLQILDRYPLDQIIERAQTPNVEVRAVVSFNDRLQAKERGYFWKPEQKLWVKQLKLNMVAIEKEAAPFPVVLMTEAVNA